MIILHQFPFSHFNEKARWALAHKGVSYERRSYLPGPHMRAIKKLSGQTATPVLQWEDEIISGSANIIEFLEQQVAENPLYPEDESTRQEALALCAELDEKLGPANRTILFSAMLEEGPYMTGMFSTGRALPVRLFYRATFPLAKGLIAKANGVNPENIARCRETTADFLERLAERLADSDYLVGDQFSVADLTAAALFGPLANPRHPDMARPEPVPSSVRAIINEYSNHPVIAWVSRIYEKHR